MCAHVHLKCFWQIIRGRYVMIEFQVARTPLFLSLVHLAQINFILSILQLISVFLRISKLSDFFFVSLSVFLYKNSKVEKADSAYLNFVIHPK